MTREELELIMNEDSGPWTGDNAFQGLQILRKYVPEDRNVLEAAEHDIIYSVDVDKILEYGITEEDAKELRRLNWMIDGDSDSLACFV
jgi:hypothetical protein